MKSLTTSRTIFLFLSSFKLLWMMNCYFSSDFEVHRNWLAITSSLPRHLWYYESTSEWTLDYPPFFAWFEWSLAKISLLLSIDDGFLTLGNLNFTSFNTIAFQRCSVMATEILYFYGAHRLANAIEKREDNQSATNKNSKSRKGLSKSINKAFDSETLLLLILANPGILFVDHIHFQYNGMMYGMQLLSIASFLENSFVIGGLWFAITLNFKHIYLYQAPAYFIYILSAYCFSTSPKGVATFSLLNLAKIGIAVLSVFAISFGPFINHLPQIMSRLFPFGRGLTHAYWAPNFWAIYSFSDRILAIFLKLTKLRIVTSEASLTRGLVGDVVFTVFPAVSPLATALLTVLFQLPILWKVWKRPSTSNFILALTLCGYSSFLFGYHVHEKAIILVLIPLAITSLWSPAFANIFLVVSASGLFSLFPLLFKRQETMIKVLVLLVYLLMAFYRLEVRLSLLQRIYVIGLCPLFVYTEFLHFFIFPPTALEFLPLMMTSVYTSFGVLYGFFSLYRLALQLE